MGPLERTKVLGGRGEKMSSMGTDGPGKIGRGVEYPLGKTEKGTLPQAENNNHRPSEGPGFIWAGKGQEFSTQGPSRESV